MYGEENPKSQLLQEMERPLWNVQPRFMTLNALLRHPHTALYCVGGLLLILGTWFVVSGPSDPENIRLVALLLCVLCGFAGALFVLIRIRSAFVVSVRNIHSINEFVAANRDGENTNAALPALEQACGIQILDEMINTTRDTVSQLLDTTKAMSNEVEAMIERYELLTNNIAASVVVRDTSGEVLFASPYTEVLTGYSLDEIHDSEGDFFESLVLEKDLERYTRARNISRLGEDIVVRYQIRHRRGIKLWLETHLVPVLNESGDVISVMSVSTDVTASVTYQEQIEQQNQDLSDFSYMVSHDLKAPVFTIKGMAALLIEDYEDEIDEDGKESIEHIIEGANRLEQLIKSVIEYSSLSTKSISEEDVDLNHVLENVVSDLAQQIKDANATVTFDSLPSVRGEQLRLYQVFSNLVGNAIKYCSPERAPQISLKVREQLADTVVVDVIDNGRGIPEDKIKDVFRPYHRAHGNEIEGSGIGLACVKKIVDRIGGTISVKSIEGKGSIFSIVFKTPQQRPQAIPQDLARVFE